MTNIMHKTVCERIRTRRMILNLSQAELAKRCGMSAARISDAERGKGALLVKTLDRIAAGLKVKTVYFFRA